MLYAFLLLVGKFSQLYGIISDIIRYLTQGQPTCLGHCHRISDDVYRVLIDLLHVPMSGRSKTN